MFATHIQYILYTSKHTRTGSIVILYSHLCDVCVLFGCVFVCV